MSLLVEKSKPQEIEPSLRKYFCELIDGKKAVGMKAKYGWHVNGQIIKEEDIAWVLTSKISQL